MRKFKSEIIIIIIVVIIILAKRIPILYDEINGNGHVSSLPFGYRVVIVC